MDKTIRWGIVGTGAIAAKFATALRSLPEAALVAIGSRTQAAADRFGENFLVPRRHGSYEALVNDAEVDAVYVATPHNVHKENALAAINARKAVLVEKPFSINAGEAEQVLSAALAQQVTVMEAMWTRFLPLYVHLRKLISEGSLGDTRLFTADFGISAVPENRPRLFDPSLGGGALLDVGVYPVSLASMFFGVPSGVTGFAQIGSTGVDELDSILLEYPGGRLASLNCSITVGMNLEAELCGTLARVRIHAPLWKSQSMTLTQNDGTETELKFPLQGNGYEYEAVHFMRLMREGKLESPLMSWEETRQVMVTMDQLRAAWKLKYPCE